MADIFNSDFPLRFVEESEPIGSLSSDAKWTCNICGVKDSDTGCTHLLQWLNNNYGKQARETLAQLHGH